MERPNLNPATPSKRRVITIDVKKQIIEASTSKNITDLCQQFGLPRSTVTGILKNKLTILRGIDDGGEATRARGSFLSIVF